MLSLNVGGDELEDLSGDRHTLPLGLLSKDRQPCLELGWLDIRREAPFEAAPQPVFQVAIDRGGRSEDRTICLLLS